MTLLYIYDPLCGWCYGFSPVIQEFAEKHQDHFDVGVISGGMITGERIGPIGEVAGYISKAYRDVEKATGISFGKSFLEGTMKKGTAIFTSIPPSKAMAIFKTKYPDKALEYASSLQKAIYYDGVVPTNIEHFALLAESYGWNREEFLEKLDTQQAEDLMQRDFQISHELGISGFPTVLISVNDQLYVLARGYTNLKNLEKQFEHLQKILTEKENSN
jgi:putative protein-disulfide isomerase